MAVALRHRFIRMRTQVKNSLRALALSAGSVKKMWLFGPRGRAELCGLPMTSAMSRQRDGWLELPADLSGRVVRLDEQLKQIARGDQPRRLATAAHLPVEAAHTAAKRDAGLKQFYQRLVYRRGAAKAKVAVARKLLIRGYIIPRDRVDYGEFLRRGVEARPARLAT